VSSCVNYEKTLLLKDAELSEEFGLSTDSIKYLVQTGDLLSIKVASPDLESAAIFNGAIGEKDASFLNSYQVNGEGNIYFPMVGEIEVRGLTVDQVRDIVESKLQSYFKLMTVTVRLLSFKVTFIGEVKEASTLFLNSDRINFFQALSQVGGLTAFSNTSNVKVLRTLDDKTIVKTIDVGDVGFVNSEFYYLKPNDVVYIQPLRSKARRENLPIVSLGLSVLTLFLLGVRSLN
jgi:polysaccharide export outer membrane protein